MKKRKNLSPSPLLICIFIYNCVAENKLLIVKLGGLDQLIRQMGSPNAEVQCNAVGCITNLATHGKRFFFVDLLLEFPF